MSETDLTAVDGPKDDAGEVRRAKQRDSSVWAAWHDRYYASLYRYAFVRLSNQDDAEDIASQVFLEALKSIDRFTYQGRPVLAWLYGIANNLVLKRRRELARAPGHTDGALDEADSSLQEEEATVQRLLVSYALEKLKKEHREVLVLRYLLDMPTKDVARAINKTEPATYSLLFRALEAAHAVLASGSETRTHSGLASRRKVA